MKSFDQKVDFYYFEVGWGIGGNKRVWERVFFSEVGHEAVYTKANNTY